jgi:arylsulfatase A-like enzyme
MLQPDRVLPEVGVSRGHDGIARGEQVGHESVAGAIGGATLRRFGVALLSIAIGVATGCGADRQSGTTGALRHRPNILLILVDALRRDHVGLYGCPRPTTPFLDELGGRGVVFDDALSQAPQTLNSTASLFTSRLFPFLLWGVEHRPIPEIDPGRRDQWARTPRLADANLTLAEVMRTGGFETVALLNNPHHHATSGFNQGFDHARLLDRDPGQAYARVDSVAAAFLRWHDGRSEDDRPYFAYLHLMDPHNPYRPPERYRELFPPGDGRHLYANGPPDPSFTAADLAAMTALYDAEIRFVDDELRTLLGELDRRRGLADTLVVITADHGDELLEHGGLGHGKTVELEQLRVPLLIAGGPVDPVAGRRIETLVRNLDLAPTLVELAGLEVPGEFEGRSLGPLIFGDEPSEAAAPPSFAWIGGLRSLTSSRWHCTRDLERGELRLYDRAVDPMGVTDVASAHPDLAALCMAEIDRLEAGRIESVRRSKALRASESGVEVPPESTAVLRRLEALGYAGE